jgi:iron complex outermembrane receptor protein
MALSTFRLSILAAAAALGAAGGAAAQTDAIVITGRNAPAGGIGGFADQPLASTPQQAAVFGTEQLADTGTRSIGGLTRLDASVADAYNAEGYWSQLSARGYVLDNRFNYLRDGLPINAETAIALDNKARLELLKGTSGIQAGTSAPGGLVNLVVKRPVAALRSARLEVRDAGSVLGAVDLSDRFGVDGAFGLRLNAAAERLDPPVRRTKGERALLALAADWQLNADGKLEAEFESSWQSQPSVVGFSLFGNSVPDPRAIDPKLNLNDQPWRQPVVMNGTTVSLRWTQRLAGDWRLSAHAMTQRLRSDDRTAFPYGCYDATNDIYYGDRYCPNGDFDLYDYRSENERRRSDALDLHVDGALATGALRHALTAGVLFTRFKGRFQDQAFNYAGTGNVFGTAAPTDPAPDLTDANTNRDERGTEFYLRDAVRLNANWQLWAGLRHTRLERRSERTSPDDNDSLRETAYTQSATLPWLALSRTLSAQTLVYASWGQGLESDVAPNRPRYTNAGQALPALKSRQIEVGVKHDGPALGWGLAWFDIDRPQAVDSPACTSADDSCTRVIDGSARHRGVEALLAWRGGPWGAQASAMWLDAARQGSSQDGVNGLRPVNVPRGSLRLNGSYRPIALPGVELNAGLTAEGDRLVLPDDNSVRIPGWSRIDVGARWQQRVAETRWTWRAGIDNLTNRRAWKESPNEFGHVYLYPLAPRTWRVSVDASF